PDASRAAESATLVLHEHDAGSGHVRTLAAYGPLEDKRRRRAFLRDSLNYQTIFVEAPGIEPCRAVRENQAQKRPYRFQTRPCEKGRTGEQDDLAISSGTSEFRSRRATSERMSPARSIALGSTFMASEEAGADLCVFCFVVRRCPSGKISTQCLP